MLDLSILKNLWTEDGARDIFARLVTHCVRSHFPGATTIRPDPGDEGIDVVSGRLQNSSKIWQSKYFADRIGNSQKKQIRDSFDTCMASGKINGVTKWTLAVPIEFSVDEKKWWDTWKRKKESLHAGLIIELWTRTDFERFYANPDLRPIFNLCLTKSEDISSLAALLEMLSPNQHYIKAIPSNDHLSESIFVKKLEAADICQHRAARVAFYNFELVREFIERGGTSEEKEQLRDLQERVYELWENEFNACSENTLGKVLYSTVNQKIKDLDRTQLASKLGLKNQHKVGILHYWADLCEAGWTKDFKQVFGGEEDDE